MRGTTHRDWQPDSWQKLPIKQQPEYQDEQKLRQVLDKISLYPPLVFSGEVEKLRRQFAEASEGRRFVLQGGDCAERFQDCNQEAITSKIKILLQMSVILCYGLRKPVVRVGRIAGQYAKPRSNRTEEHNGQQIPVFRGDTVNSFEPDQVARQADPNRLLQGYHCSASTLNYVRALVTGGFADLHYPEHWNLGYYEKSPQKSRYQDIVRSIKDAIAFFESLGGVKSETLGSIEFFTSHEGLLLNYEQAMTRAVGSQFFNLGTHMLWIGDRTRQLNGAHVEYFRGISNPVGVKVGPSIDPDELIEIIRALNPGNEAGKIVLISRFGHSQVQSHLPSLIEKVARSECKVLWTCDPMHGNVIKAKNGIKTRDFDAILAELRNTFDIHQQQNSILGGVHFELTGEDVTECTGGAESVREEDLVRSYETFCDPRLNYSQSLEMAFLISTLLQDRDVPLMP